MQPSVIVWDLETVPDLAGFAAASGLVGKSDVEIATTAVCLVERRTLRAPVVTCASTANVHRSRKPPIQTRLRRISGATQAAARSTLRPSRTRRRTTERLSS
jgi:hypothetical protein